MVREGLSVGRPKDLTLFEAAELYLDWSLDTHSPGTHATTKGALQPAVDDLGNQKLSKLTAPRIERWLAGRAVAPDTKRNYVKAIRAAIKYCKRSKLYSGEDATQGVALPKAGRRERTLAPAERLAIWESATPALRDLVLVLSATGARPHVVEAIEARDVDWNAGTVTLHSKLKPHTVHLPDHVLRRLKELAAERPKGKLLLGENGRPWIRGTRAAAVRAACEKAGVAGVVPYTMRHSFITDALASNLSPAIVAELVNHKDLNMIARHYSKLAQRRDVLKQAAEDAARASWVPPVPETAPAPTREPATAPDSGRRQRRKP
jgi:integrase